MHQSSIAWCASDTFDGTYRRGGALNSRGFRAIKLLFLFITAFSPLAGFASDEVRPSAGPIKAPATIATDTPRNTATADFSLAATPGTIQLLTGGAAKVLTLSAAALDGFKQPVKVELTSLPAGVTASPASLTITPGGHALVALSAATQAKHGKFSIKVTGVAGSLTHASTFAVEVSSTPTTATISTLLFNFGDNLVGNKLTETAVVVTNTGKSGMTLNPKLTGGASFAIVSSKSCGTTLAAGKSCDMVLTYLPTVASYPNPQQATLAFNFGNTVAGVPGQVLISGTSASLGHGNVTATANPQVALYTMTLPFPGRIQVNFGPTTSYGTKTWWQSTDENHGVISIFVAGMKASSTYHMAAHILFDNGITAVDEDHAFKTGVVPADLKFAVTATTTAGMKPQPGIEFTNYIKALEAFDLQGNLIWTYAVPTPYQDDIDGAKFLPNGDILVAIGVLSNAPLTTPVTTSQVNEIREIDLAGDTVREISITDLNAELQTATCKECQDAPGVPLVLETFHHDVTPLPNGHWLVLSNEIRNLSPTSTPPLTNLSKQAVIGDVIVDLDENMNPVWVWNEFNHLDPNRHPWVTQFPDWTHTNAILYSPDDGNMIVSIRHQNWVLKVNYDNGRGDGSILWKLGEGGTLKLVGGVDPTDWPYAQHGPGFFSPNTSGVFSLGIMDNGDDRLYPAGSSCTPQSSLPAKCLYSTIPVFKIDESAQTATLTFHQIIPAADYSSFGGNTEELANGNVEYDLCGIGTTSLVREVTQDAAAKTVWSMTTNSNFYRAFRVPSLYPGEQW